MRAIDMATGIIHVSKALNEESVARHIGGVLKDMLQEIADTLTVDNKGSYARFLAAVKEQDYKWRRCVRIVNAYNGTTVKLSPEAFSKLIERVIPSLYNDVKVPAYMGIAQALSCAITGANPQTNIILKAALEEANKKAVDTHGTSGD